MHILIYVTLKTITTLLKQTIFSGPLHFGNNNFKQAADDVTISSHGVCKQKTRVDRSQLWLIITTLNTRYETN